MDLLKPTVFVFAAFVYDAENRRLTRNRVPVRINKQMLDLLDLLVRNGGRLVTREQIQNALWPEQFLDNREKQITNAVSRLRHILGDNPAQPRYIESVPRTGYRLIARITPVELPAKKSAQFPALLAVETGANDLALGESSLGTVAAVENEAEVESAAMQLREVLPAAIIRTGVTETDASLIAVKIPEPAGARRRSRLHVGLRLALFMAVIVLLVAGLLIAWRLSVRKAVLPPTEISLGIAPFHTSGSGAADLAQSFRLDLTDTLAQLPHVNVRASNSLDLMSLDQATFRDQATRLGLDVLIIGSFTLEGNNCHVQLELVRGKDLSHIANFNRTVSRFELARLRDMIRNEVYTSLKLAPASGGLLSSPVGGTSDSRAYDAYLRASFHYSQLTKDSLPLAVSEYSEAIAADPQFVNAYAGQARAYVYLVQNDLIGEQEGYRLASEAAHRALSVNPHSAEAHAALGFIYFLHNWNLSAGEDEFRQAVAVNPNDPFYHQGLALIFCDEGRFHEAEAEIDQAHVVDPFWASAYITEAHIASVAGDRARVQAAIRKIMELVPDSAHARDGIGNAEWNLGLHAEAIATWREMAEIEKDAGRAAMEDRGMAEFRRGGAPAYAQVRIDAIRNGMKTAPHSNDFFAAEWYAQANQTEEALKAIHAAIAAHDGSVPGMAVLPAYASLRSNAEFQAILAGLGLTLHARAGY